MYIYNIYIYIYMPILELVEIYFFYYSYSYKLLGIEMRLDKGVFAADFRLRSLRRGQQGAAEVLHEARDEDLYAIPGHLPQLLFIDFKEGLPPDRCLAFGGEAKHFRAHLDDINDKEDDKINEKGMMHH